MQIAMEFQDGFDCVVNNLFFFTLEIFVLVFDLSYIEVSNDFTRILLISFEKSQLSEIAQTSRSISHWREIVEISFNPIVPKIYSLLWFKNTVNDRLTKSWGHMYVSMYLRVIPQSKIVYEISGVSEIPFSFFSSFFLSGYSDFNIDVWGI